MKYRLLYHAFDMTSDDDPGISSYRHFYAKDDDRARKKVRNIVRYSYNVEMGFLTPLKLLRVVQRKTVHKEEITLEVDL